MRESEEVKKHFDLSKDIYYYYIFIIIFTEIVFILNKLSATSRCEEGNFCYRLYAITLNSLNVTLSFQNFSLYLTESDDATRRERSCVTSAVKYIFRVN